MNDCIKNLFFYNDYSDLVILLNNFAIELRIVIIRKRINVITIFDD